MGRAAALVASGGMLIGSCLLLCLRSGPAHTHALHRMLRDRIGAWRAVAPAQIRTTLRRMAASGWLDEDAPDSRHRVLFRLNPAGRRIADGLAAGSGVLETGLLEPAPDERVARLARILELGGPWQMRAAARRECALLMQRRRVLARRSAGTQAEPLHRLIEALLEIEIEWLQGLIAQPDAALPCPPDGEPDRAPDAAPRAPAARGR